MQCFPWDLGVSFAQAPATIFLFLGYRMCFLLRRHLCHVCWPFCPAAASSLTCIPVLGGSMDFTLQPCPGVLGTVRAVLALWPPQEEELGPVPPAPGEGQSSVPSLGTAWSCRNPSRGAELPLSASACHLQPCRHLVPLPVPSTQDPWLLELSGNWELHCHGDFAGNGLGSCASPWGTDKGAPSGPAHL